jgi:hypothetical protein
VIVAPSRLRPRLLRAGVGMCLLALPRPSHAAEAAASFPPGAPLVFPGEVSRKSDSGVRHGPWKSAVASAGLPRAAKIGDLITVVPMSSALPAVDLKVTSVHFQEATDLTPATWLVEAETTLPAFLDAKPDAGRADEHPFEAVVVYPKTSRARLLPKKSVAKDLPPGRGHSPQTLWAVVDLDEDGAADVEVFRFCCNRPRHGWVAGAGPSPCDTNCEDIFLRPKGGTWTLAHESGEF